LGGGLPVRFRGLPVFQIALFGLYFGLCNGNYDLGPDTQPAAPPVRAWAKHRPGLGGARRAVHVRRRVSGSTGRLDGRNGHLAKAVTATSGVASDARSAARCARSGAASPRVRVGGSAGAGGWEGGLPVRFRGLPVFQIALFGLYWPNYVTVTMISGPTPDRRPPVRAWAKPCPGGRGREGLGPVRPRVSASRHGFQLPDTASSFRPASGQFPGVPNGPPARFYGRTDRSSRAG
jgi:hypothetical protein